MFEKQLKLSHNTIHKNLIGDEKNLLENYSKKSTAVLFEID